MHNQIKLFHSKVNFENYLFLTKNDIILLKQKNLVLKHIGSLFIAKYIFCVFSFKYNFKY